MAWQRSVLPCPDFPYIPIDFNSVGLGKHIISLKLLINYYSNKIHNYKKILNSIIKKQKPKNI